MTFPADPGRHGRACYTLVMTDPEPDSDADSDCGGDEVLAVARELWGDEAEATLAELRQLRGPITPEHLAEMQELATWNRRLRDRRLQPARRSCLGPLCKARRRFDSEHAGERICPRCRAYLARRYGVFEFFDEAS